jgi:predicted aspartyl protease
MSGGELPFKVSDGFLIVVEGRIGPLNKLKFILDTGTSHSVVDRKTADKLRLVRHANQASDFNHVIRVESATFPDVQIASIRIANVSMLVADLADFSTFASDVDALIGSDFLSLTTFTIDYDQKKLQFGSLPNPESMNSRNPDVALLTVELSVQNQHVRLLVDSGFPDILLFEDRLRKRVTQLKVEHVIKGFQLGGRLRAKRAVLPKIRLGAGETDLGILMADGPPDNVLSSIDGLLGIASLKAHRIHFDYARNQLSWE